jgi:hypothetical protein
MGTAHEETVTMDVRCNDMINAREVAGLAELMTEDHRFVDGGKPPP